MSARLLEGRLHPLSMLASVPGTLAQLWPALVVPVVLRPSLSGAAFAAVLVAVAGIAAGAVRWWRFRYIVFADRVEVTEGLFVRRDRMVPLERVRGVSIEEPFLHRVVGLVKLRLEVAAAGSDEAEVSLDGITRARAEEVRRAVMPGSRADADAEPPVARMGAAMALLAGATTTRFVAVPAAAIGAAVGFANDFAGLRTLWELAVRAGRWLPQSATGVAAGVAMAVVVALALGALASLLIDGAFRVRLNRAHVVTERGLVARRRTTVDRSRVLGVEIIDNLPRRVLGASVVECPVSGMSWAPRGDVRGAVRVLPLGTRAAGVALAEAVVPGPYPPLRPHPIAGLPRRVARAVTLPAAAGIVAVVTGFWWAATGAAALALIMAAVALDRHRNLGHGVNGLLHMRSGSLVRRRTVVHRDGVVAVSLHSSPFQRRRGLRTARVHLGVGVGARPVIDADSRRAEALAADLMPWARDDLSPGARPASG